MAFEGQYDAIHVEYEAYLLHLTRYIHRNPLKARLVSRLEDWEFSSYPDYIGVRSGTFAHPKVILQEFAGPRHYQTFVEQIADEGSIRHLMIDEDD